MEDIENLDFISYNLAASVNGLAVQTVRADVKFLARLGLITFEKRFPSFTGADYETWLRFRKYRDEMGRYSRYQAARRLLEEMKNEQE